jgi:UDP-glucuronate 4-epimerase
MTILVTGGAGFIGSHVAEALLQNGEAVVCVDNFNDYYDPQLKRANASRLAQYPALKMIEADIRQADTLQALFRAQGIQKVIHLAAMAGVRNSIEQVGLYMEVNTMGTMNLLEAARHHGVSQFIFGSTSSVYGATPRLPFVEEDTADRPLAAYPASKRAAEILAHSYHHLFGMNITVLRFFNVYGPAGRPDMMPLRLMHSIYRQEAIPVFNGGDLQRDWTYIDDTVRGILAATERPLGYEIINLGLGQPLSLNAFIQTIEGLTGKTAIRENKVAPLSEPPITFCNNEKARRLLGFAPSTPVDVGLARTWEWFKRHFGLY